MSRVVAEDSEGAALRRTWLLGSSFDGDQGGRDDEGGRGGELRGLTEELLGAMRKITIMYASIFVFGRRAVWPATFVVFIFVLFFLQPDSCAAGYVVTSVETKLEIQNVYTNC